MNIEKIKQEYQVLAIGIYGSQNYGLQTELSDTDYLVIVNEPTDTFSFRQELDDYKVISKRMFIEKLTHAGYPIFYEILDLQSFTYLSKEFQREFIDQKDTWLYCNLDKFSASLKVEWYKGYKHLTENKGFSELSSHQVYLDRYGYSTKLIQHSMRLKSFFERFHLGLRGKDLYSVSHLEKEHLQRIKNGYYSKEECLDLLNRDKPKVFELRRLYKGL